MVILLDRCYILQLKCLNTTIEIVRILKIDQILTIVADMRNNRPAIKATSAIHEVTGLQI